MAKFTYRMQNILDIKIKLENQAKIAEGSKDVGSEDKILYDVNAVTDNGADNTGNVDATTAIQGAINQVKDSGGIVSSFRNLQNTGQYRCSGRSNP